MSKVITFSTKFPSYHPRAGEPTFFIEQILNSLGHAQFKKDLLPEVRSIVNDFVIIDGQMKHHTIRAGNRWKVGDKFSPRVWSGKPYNSKQIIISPDIEIKKVWDFEIDPLVMQNINAGDKYVFVKINGHNVWCNASIPDNGIIDLIAKNDGLLTADFKAWFKWGQPFKGQIICWNEKIDY